MSSPPPVVSVRAGIAAITTAWDPRLAARVNDHDIKLVRLDGNFVWHAHADTDEVFYVLSGTMDMEFRDGTRSLQKGDLIVVPAGVEHRPANAVAEVMLIERVGTLNTGDHEGEVPAHIHQHTGR